MSATNLSGLLLTLGDLPAALVAAKEAMDLADRSANQTDRLRTRATLADARHQAGESNVAIVFFREAEAIQNLFESPPLLLYSLHGFLYCDLLLACPEQASAGVPEAKARVRIEDCAEVEVRAAETLKISQRFNWPFIIGLDYLSLGRAQLYRAIVNGGATPDLLDARGAIENAVVGLRAGGQIEYLPRGLLTRAWLRDLLGDEDGARADLDEAQEIAERGEMKLHLADVALYRARLFDDRVAFAIAKKLVEECGYFRRRAEIAAVEASFS